MEKFNYFLDNNNKEEALNYIINKLQNKEMNIIDLYENIIFKTLRNKECKLNDKNICQWKEHVKSSSVRTIIENCYPYVLKERKKVLNKTAVVLCPTEEYYDIEARMFTDYLTILGFDTIFVGANTPYEDFFNVIKVLNPSAILISVDNYYNAIGTKKMIDDMKKVLEISPKIIVSGNAFINDRELYKKINATYQVNNYNELEKVVENI